MKSLFTTLALFLATTVVAVAQRAGSMPSILRIRMADGAMITVEVDGRRYDRVNDRFTIGDLPAGRHDIKVYRVNANNGSRRIPARLVWENRIRLAAATITSITVEGSGNRARISTRPNDQRYTTNNNNRNRYEDDRTWDDYSDDRIRNGEVSGNDDRNTTGRNAFSSRDMDALQRQVAARTIDGDKFSGIKTAVGNRSLTVEQVRVMMGWLTFESTKVDLAKWAYRQTSDNRDYWTLEREFTFQSSKDELQQVIRSGNGGDRGRD